MAKPKIGVIGAGIYGSKVIKAYHSAHLDGSVDFAAFSEINPTVMGETESKFGIKGYLDYKEMVARENLDGVAIVTPDYLHAEITNYCAENGLHMLVQKPLDTTTDGARRMVATAKKQNVMLFVDFHKRYDPGHLCLRNDIDAGKLGKVQYGYVHMEDQIRVPSIWFKNWAQHSSPVWFIGVHFFDLIYWLMRSKPVEVYATGVKEKLVSMGIDTYDSLQSKFKFENGASFIVDACWILPDSFTAGVNQGIRVVGTEGMMEVDSEDRGVLAAFSSDKTAATLNPYGHIEVPDLVHGGTRLSGYTIESMLHFLKLLALLKGGKTLKELDGLYPSGDEAIVSTRMCEAAHQSAVSGKIEALNL